MDTSPVEICVEIWTISLREERGIILSAEEAERAARFRFEEDRVRWTRAHSALRQVLAEYARQPAAELSFEIGAHGKPSLREGRQIEFSLSHAGDWAMIAVSHGVPVGVDIERARRGIDMGPLLQRLGELNIPESGDAKLTAWTRREARSKAQGGALFDAPAEDVYAISLEAPEGYAASVALVGFTPRVVYRR